MNHLLNITKKELKELLTPGSIMSVIVVMILFMTIGSMTSFNTDDMSSPTKIGFINGDEPSDTDTDWGQYALNSVYDFYGSYGLTPEEAAEYVVLLESPFGDNNSIAEEMISNGITAAFGIIPTFSEDINHGVRSSINTYYVFENEGLFSSVASVVTSAIPTYIADRISGELVSDVADPSAAGFILNPISFHTPYTYIEGETYEGVTPSAISASVMSQTLMVPLIIMIVIVMIGSIVISSVGNEKENKTLETLLTIPVKRTTIVGGKLLASAVTGLIFGLGYMIGMAFYMNGITAGIGTVNLADYGISIGMIDWVIIGIMIFLAIFCALGMCMILGAFAKNYKTAQTMTLPISVLAMVPMFVTMFMSWDALPGVLHAVLFAIPFTHPMMVMENLMFGNYEFVIAGLIYLLIFTLVTVYLTVRIYKSDILITGLKLNIKKKVKPQDE